MEMSQVVKQLRKERDKVERQLTGLNAALSAFVGTYAGKAKATRKRRRLSSAARKRISDAQKARWAKYRRKT